MFNFSKQTKSFLTLILIAFISVMTAYYLSGYASRKNTDPLYIEGSSGNYKPNHNNPKNVTDSLDDEKTIDTSTWKTFKDKRFDFTFKYPSDWNIKTLKEDAPDGMYIIQLDTGKDLSAVRIYVSDKHFFAMDGLPTVKTTIAGQKALNVADMLIGIQKNSKYYTFDLGGNTKAQPEFKTLVSQVDFSK